MTAQRPQAQALPLYLQISEVLLRDIAAGRLVDGERLPPERDMARQHATSVTTLRKALAELESKGLLERIQGSGNYIRAGQGMALPGEYSMFRLELREGGGLPTTRLIAVDHLAKDHRWGPDQQASRVRRLRLLGGRRRRSRRSGSTPRPGGSSRRRSPIRSIATTGCGSACGSPAPKTG